MTELLVTGSELGGTPSQMATLTFVIVTLRPEKLITGACVGIDAKAFAIAARARPPDKLWGELVAYPANDVAMGKVSNYCIGVADELHEAARALDRDDTMAHRCSFAVAVPSTDHMGTRSGTWTTVRRCLKYRKLVLIIQRDGTVRLEK
jgi:hypothetical protein